MGDNAGAALRVRQGDGSALSDAAASYWWPGYLRAMSKLASGQVIAAAVPFLAAPVIGRLYAPGDYALLATFVAMSGVLGTFSTLQLANGVIAEHDDRRSHALVVICLGMSLAMAIAIGFVACAVIWSGQGIGWLGETRMWLLFLPLTMLAAGVMTTVRTYANRVEQYDAMGRIPVLVTVVTTGTTLVLGLLGAASSGPILGFLAGQGATLALYGWLYRSLPRRSWSFGRLHALALVDRHKRFALFSLPSAFVGAVNLELPVYALTAVGAQSDLGAFNRARYFAGTPFMLIGGAAGEVYRQRASNEYRQHHTCRRTLERTAVGLFAIGVAPAAALILFGPQLFEFVLGPKWGPAGEIARILAPMFLLRIIASPIAQTLLITGHQRREFMLAFAGLIVTSGLVTLAAIAGLPSTTIIWVYSGSMCLNYVGFLCVSWIAAQA